MASQSYLFSIPQNKSPQDLVQTVVNYLSSNENMETQVLVPDQNGTLCVVQGRVRGGGLRQFFGLDKAITVRFNMMQDGRTVNVEVGEAKWGDKAAVFAVSMFILWPLAVTSAVGAYQQQQLPQKIFNVIQQYLNA